MNDNDAPLIAMLEKDDGVHRLVMGMSLSDRFHFYLLACDIPRAAATILDILRERVPREREEPVRFLVLDPYVAHTKVLEPIPYDLLVREVLARLISPAPDERTADVVFVVDASRAVAQDEPSWMLLFQRMNEDRNTISNVLGGPLLLVLPERLEPLFAHAAPDVWSIRSSAVLVRVPNDVLRRNMFVEPAPTWVLPEQAVAEVQVNRWPIEEIDREIAVLQGRLTAHPDDESAQESLAIWLGRRIHNETHAGKFEQSLDAGEDMLRLARQRLHRHPETIRTWTIALLLAHEMAKAARRWGYLERSDRLYESAIELVRSACELHPDNEEFHATRWEMLLESAQNVAHRRGWLIALRSCEEARDIALQFHERAPDRVDWLYRLASALNHIGVALAEFDNLEQMLEVQEKAIFYSERAQTLAPQSFEITAELCTGHLGHGEAYRHLGALSLALDAYERGTKIARGWLVQDPNNIRCAEICAMGLDLIAVVQGLLGYEQRALEARNEAIDILRNCVQSAPDERKLLVSVALMLTAQAEHLEKVGNVHAALDQYRDAVSTFERVARTGALPPLVQSTVEQCRESITRIEAARAKMGVRDPTT